jgi:hypothetical protein
MGFYIYNRFEEVGVIKRKKACWLDRLIRKDDIA